MSDKKLYIDTEYNQQTLKAELFFSQLKLYPFPINCSSEHSYEFWTQIDFHPFRPRLSNIHPSPTLNICTYMRKKIAKF